MGRTRPLTQPEQFGKYQLVARLAHGRMGDTYKAKYQGVEGFARALVVRVLKPVSSSVPGFLDLVAKEVRRASALSHANVVRLLELGQEPERQLVYIAMEYIHGVNLQRARTIAQRSSAPWPFELSIFIAAELANGLHYAHRLKDPSLNNPLGIVHCDLCPANVLLSVDGEVKIADFGFGRAMTTVPPRDSKGLVRRVLYTAPEVIAGHPYTAKSDIFALGLMLYEMLVGTHPYLGASADQVYQRASQGAIPPLHEHVLLPRPLAKLIESMLAPEPARRIYSAGSIYEQLIGYIFDHNLMADARTLAAFVQDVHKDEHQHFSEETPPEVGLEEIALDDVLIPEASPPFAQDPSSAGARFTGEPMSSEQPSLPGRLEEYFAATCAGRGKAVLLHGHLGAGREYLPDRLPDVLELRGSTLAFCAQLTRDDTHRPFGALGDIVLQSMHALVPEDTPVAPYSAIAALKSLGLSSEARDTLAGLWHIGEPSRAGYREQRAHLEEVCTRVLVELCKRTTVVCAIDRVELLDPLSMDIVRSLLSTISSLPAMLLLSTLHVERAAKALDTSNPEHLRTIRVVGSTPQSSPRLAASSPTPPTS